MKIRLIGGFGEMKSNGGTQFYFSNRIYDSDGLALCLVADGENPWYMVKEKNEHEREDRRDEPPVADNKDVIQSEETGPETGDRKSRKEKKEGEAESRGNNIHMSVTIRGKR